MSGVVALARKSLGYAALLTALLALGGCADPGGSSKAVETPRLYVFDCGTLHIGEAAIAFFGLTKEDVSTTDLSVACVLVAHPKGSLIWDAGAVPDTAWKPTGAPVRQAVVPSDGRERSVTVRKPLLTQLSEAGYAPRDITYLALSHYHFDHTANANEFAASTWLVRKVERDAMFGEKPPFATQPSTYAALRNSKTTLIEGDYDVFGDGTVVLKAAPGHTPGHQSLYVKLAKTGGVLLSGDLYHFPQSRTLQRVPKFDINQEQSRTTRAGIEQFLGKTETQLWIQHDAAANAKLKKAPSYYD